MTQRGERRRRRKKAMAALLVFRLTALEISFQKKRKTV